MTLERGKILLPIARAAISRALHISCSADESPSWLDQPGACFVTLKQDGELRGCIGSLQAYRALRDDVKSNAVTAALRDPRFMPLRANELEITAIEVSLLSPIEALYFKNEADAIAQLRPELDGIVLEYGIYRSTFLPQVWQTFPHPGDFLEMLKRKAGLPEDFWAANVKLSRYTVSKWSE